MHAFDQFVLERSGVNGLAETIPAVVVYSVERANDRVHAFRFEEFSLHQPKPSFRSANPLQPFKSRPDPRASFVVIRLIRGIRVSASSRPSGHVEAPTSQQDYLPWREVTGGPSRTQRFPWALAGP